jgi:hypothetical protein
MRKFAEVNTVIKNLVNFLQEISTCLTVRAANVKLRSDSSILDTYFVNASAISAKGLASEILSESRINESSIVVH